MIKHLGIFDDWKSLYKTFCWQDISRSPYREVSFNWKPSNRGASSLKIREEFMSQKKKGMTREILCDKNFFLLLAKDAGLNWNEV